MIVREGPRVFDRSNLARIDDLAKEAGSDVYATIGPLLGEVCMPPGISTAELYRPGINLAPVVGSTEAVRVLFLYPCL